MKTAWDYELRKAKNERKISEILKRGSRAWYRI
jgi:hypothetical protein